jgi:hypothetical protein
MQNVKFMTVTDLIKEMNQRKVEAFDMAWRMRGWSPQQIAAAGYKTPFDVILRAGHLNETRMQDFEKEHKE